MTALIISIVALSIAIIHLVLVIAFIIRNRYVSKKEQEDYNKTLRAWEDSWSKKKLFSKRGKYKKEGKENN